MRPRKGKRTFLIALSLLAGQWREGRLMAVQAARGGEDFVDLEERGPDCWLRLPGKRVSRKSGGTEDVKLDADGRVWLMENNLDLGFCTGRQVGQIDFLLF